MLSYKLILATLMALFISQNSEAQKATTKATQPPSGVIMNFQTMYPGAAKIKWSNDSLQWWAQFSWEGANMKAVYTPAGYWKYSGTAVSIDSVPASLKSFVKEYLAGHQIISAKKAETPYHKGLYELELQYNGKKFFRVYSPEGVILDN